MCKCPKCGRPKACDDELCIMCELREDAIEKVKNLGRKLKKEVEHD